MRNVGYVAQHDAAVEDRGDERDVVEVHAAEVRVVDQDAVAGCQPFGAVGANGTRNDVGERA